MTVEESGARSGRAVFAARALILLAPVPGAAAWAVGTPALPVVVLSLALAGAGLATRATRGPLGAHVIATALIGQAALLTAALAGHPWQIDTHMLFFAILAVISTMGSIPALILACGLTAVHHLSLGVLVPGLVYPSSDLAGNLGRTAFHAAIVVIEGTILALSMRREDGQRRALVAHRQEADSLAEAARRARDEAEQAGADSAHVVASLSAALERLAGGDLSCRIGSPFPGPYDGLRRDFNAAVDMLARSVGGSVAAAGDVNREAAAIADCAGTVSGRVEAQAQDVTEVAEALRQLTASVGETADGVDEVSARALTARREAQEAAAVVGDAIEAMDRIEASSKEISAIITLIEDIAFQTNLLALNAGVEAARAGEAGNGFAVVASEVRALAQRTATAANDINGLITTAAGHVGRGVQLVNRTGRALEGIGAQVDEASERVRGISRAARAQAEGLTETSATVTRINESLQSNAALAEEMSAMGARMADVADRLDGTLSGFGTGPGAATAGADAPTAAA